jgi:hypothetical protein
LNEPHPIASTNAFSGGCAAAGKLQRLPCSVRIHVDLNAVAVIGALPSMLQWGLMNPHFKDL